MKWWVIFIIDFFKFFLLSIIFMFFVINLVLEIVMVVIGVELVDIVKKVLGGGFVFGLIFFLCMEVLFEGELMWFLDKDVVFKFWLSVVFVGGNICVFVCVVLCYVL